MNRTEQIKALLEAGESKSAIARKLGLNPATISYHAKKLGELSESETQFDWVAIQKFYDEGHPLSECRERFGCSNGSWGCAVKRGDIKPRKAEDMPIEEMKGRSSVRRKILRDRLLPYLCSECGQGPVWRGKSMALVLDHINGKRDDHRLENLRFLCPNCNSQTDTFCGKNHKRS